jgi:hypothetical protein
MATVSAIPEKTQSKTAMGKVMRYVAQEKKTLFSNGEKSYQLISGQNCVAETAFQEFMATKIQYGKDSGVFFKQFVQSFKPDEKATPQEIHQMGVELAKYFDGFEVLIATHIDKDHHHNHLIVNSVSCETGLKIQFNEKNLRELRNQSDEICKAFGLEVLAPYQKPEQKAYSQREYRAALKGESWKFKLMNAIDKSLSESKSKPQFINNMKKLGYEMKWIDNYKYITYTTPDGQKCRDNRLHDDKYLKSNMEVLLNGFEQSETAQRDNSRGFETAVSITDDGDTAGFMEYNRTVSERSGQISGEFFYGNRKTPEMGGLIRDDERGNLPSQQSSRDGYLSEQPLYNGHDFREDQRNGTEFELEDDGDFEEYDDGNANEGFNTVEAQSKVGVDWGDTAVAALTLAASIENMVNAGNDERQKKKKVVSEAELSEHKKHHRKSQGYRYEMGR